LSDTTLILWGFNALMVGFLVGWGITYWVMRLWDWIRWRIWVKPHCVLTDVYLENLFIDSIRKHAHVVPLGRFGEIDEEGKGCSDVLSDPRPEDSRGTG